MKRGDRVMVVANAAIRELKCGMATLESYVRTDPKPYGGYHVETWEVHFDGEEEDLGTYRYLAIVPGGGVNPKAFLHAWTPVGNPRGAYGPNKKGS